MKKVINVIRRAIERVNAWIENISVYLYVLLIAIIVFTTLQAASFCLVYLQLLNNKDVFIPAFNFINIWDILNEPITKQNIYANIDDVKMRIEFLMNVAISMSGLLLSIVTVVSYLRKVASYRRRSCFQRREIIETGKDDIQLMCNYFQGSTFVGVYSHSFSWINNKAMKNILNELAKKNKLRLYTNDNIDDVKKRLINCNESLLTCIQKTEVMVHFSYVEKYNKKYVLYRQEDEGKIYVIAVKETSESNYLLQVIENLVK